MIRKNKIFLAVVIIFVLFGGGYLLARYNTNSYANVIYHKFTGKDVSSMSIDGNSSQNTDDATKNDDGLNLVKNSLEKQKFNGSYAVIKNGKVSGNQTIGDAKNDNLYQVTDIENTLTAAAIFNLIKDGKLSSYTPISKYYGNSLSTSSNVTVKSLLNMTSGIVNNSVPNSQLQSFENVLQWNLNYANSSVSGSYNYQEINYVLLEGIVAKVSGTSYQDYINQKFIKPNKLNNIKFVNSVSDKNVAIPFNGDEKVTSTELSKNMNMQMGKNQIVASPSDFLKLMQILTKKFENEDGFLALDNQKMTGQLFADNKYYYGSGGIVGYKSALVISKNGKNGIVLMSNNSDGTVSNSSKLLDIAKKVIKEVN